MIEWIHDDITWCVHNDCPVVNCMRNPANMLNRTGLHSYADFRKTDECPIFIMEEQIKSETEGYQE